jgi:transcription initiation factor TFIIIB Brf1 subunit/transcription initiation factor TFIIB
MDEPCCDEYSPAAEVIDASSGDRICTRCGRVLEGHMMVATFADAEHCAPITGDGPGFDRVPGVHKGTMARSRDVAVRRVRQAIDLVDEVGGSLRLSERTLAWARELMRDSLEKHGARADAKLRHRAAGCVYFACKLDAVSRAENEVADALEIPRKDLQRANKALRRLLVDRPYAREMLHGVRPVSLIPRFLQAVSLDLARSVREQVPWHTVRSRAETIAGQVERECGLDGKKPQSVCAAIMVAALAPWLAVEPSRVAGVCGISSGAVESALTAVSAVVSAAVSAAVSAGTRKKISS